MITSKNEHKQQNPKKKNEKDEKEDVETTTREKERMKKILPVLNGGGIQSMIYIIFVLNGFLLHVVVIVIVR